MEKGHWKGKALIQDKKENKSHVVHLDIQAIRSSKLRVDITSPLGGHLASLVMDQGQVTYLLVKQRKYYTGKASSRVLKPLIQLPLNPKYLEQILFDQPIARAPWICRQSEKNFLETCLNKKTGLKVEVAQRSGPKRLIRFEHKSGQVQMNLSDFEPSIDSRENLFALKRPSSFKAYKVR